eukprot:7553_1
MEMSDKNKAKRSAKEYHFVDGILDADYKGTKKIRKRKAREIMNVDEATVLTECRLFESVMTGFHTRWHVINKVEALNICFSNLKIFAEQCYTSIGAYAWWRQKVEWLIVGCFI